MKVILDIKDNEAAFVLELLKNFSFVKAKPLSPNKAEVFENLQAAVEEMKMIKSGKATARNAKELFDEF